MHLELSEAVANASSPWVRKLERAGMPTSRRLSDSSSSACMPSVHRWPFELPPPLRRRCGICRWHRVAVAGLQRHLGALVPRRDLNIITQGLFLLGCYSTWMLDVFDTLMNSMFHVLDQE